MVAGITAHSCDLCRGILSVSLQLNTVLPQTQVLQVLAAWDQTSPTSELEMGGIFTVAEGVCSTLVYPIPECVTLICTNQLGAHPHTMHILWWQTVGSQFKIRGNSSLLTSVQCQQHSQIYQNHKRTRTHLPFPPGQLHGVTQGHFLLYVVQTLWSLWKCAAYKTGIKNFEWYSNVTCCQIVTQTTMYLSCVSAEQIILVKSINIMQVYFCQGFKILKYN